VTAATWRPRIADGIAEDRGLEGTHANKGTFVDSAGKSHEVWMTSRLHFPKHELRSAAEQDRQIRERQAMHVCETVTLRVGWSAYPLPVPPHYKRWELYVKPAHPGASGSPAAEEVCRQFQEPQGEPSSGYSSYGTDGGVLSQCRDNYFVISLHPRTTGFPPTIGVTAFKLALAIDGSLIIKGEVLSDMSNLSDPSRSAISWARFEKAP